MVDVTGRIKERARELGFQKVGICSAQPPQKLALLADWLDRGNLGAMQWLERTREKRLDIGKVLPGVRSVIVVGLNYFSENPPAPAGFRISRYARGSDYHPLVEQRLRSLSAYLLELLPGALACTYCDTGPVSEKIWAESAGIGWQGKHSILLTREYSSWLFLGALLTDASLEYDQPAADHCGSCTRCIEACPTQAITEPCVVDGRRCISYLTIEHRGIVPEELRSGIGNWIYGCDICQEVCPWARFSQPTAEEAFRPSDLIAGADAPGWLELSADEFNRLFADSPLRRSRRAGLLRNLVVAMGNARDPRFGPPLAKALDHPEPLVRGHAAWALGRCPWDGTHAALRRHLASETDPWVRQEISTALSSTSESR